MAARDPLTVILFDETRQPGPVLQANLSVDQDFARSLPRKHTRSKEVDE